ncbi:MAG: sulfotransferase [Anaerolineales bacterium]|nr:sulfotransferase [Anaerolineales bacterium]
MTPKRFLVLVFLFLFYPLWHFSIRIAYLLDNLFYPEHQLQEIRQPIFIIGNFRSGTTFLHRLLVKDRNATSLTSWEIYVAPSIVGRKLLHWGMRLNYAIGNPAQLLLNTFDQIMAEYSSMHKIGLNEPEEDGLVMFHIWSSYDLLAFFPFPDLIRKYFYYDDQIPAAVRERDMLYYHEVLKKHIFSHHGKRYISKNPSYSPKVRTLHKEFPDAKFINLVRNPLQVIPSSISLLSNHLHTYGEPETDYALQDTVIEYSKHWYLYPHRYLKRLPPDQYIRIRYTDLVADPKGTVERIYHQFGLEISPEYERVLQLEAKKAKGFRSNHRYSLKSMGLNKRRILREFAGINRQLHFENIKQKK